MTVSVFLPKDGQASADVIGNPRKPSMPEAPEAAWAKLLRSLEWKLRLGIDLPEPFTLEDAIEVLSESIESIEEK